MKKLNFTVVAITGEADGFSAKNLEKYYSTSPGWQSPRCCLYPQELIFKLHEQSKIKLLQVLSHQFMISSKIEFYVSTNSSPQGIFKGLGYIYLSDNYKNNFKSRELKSIHVDVDALFIKLIIYRNHSNKLNSYNQVGIHAINMLGISYSFDRKSSIILEDGMYKSDVISPFDDLAFEMYLDSDISAMMRKLDEKKKKAIIEDRFDEAKRLKQAMIDLQQVGERLAKYQHDKQSAIENENFDQANLKKLQIDDFRLRVYHGLQKHNLLQDVGLPLKLSLDKGVSPLKALDLPKKDNASPSSCQDINVAEKEGVPLPPENESSIQRDLPEPSERNSSASVAPTSSPLSGTLLPSTPMPPNTALPSSAELPSNVELPSNAELLSNVELPSNSELPSNARLPSNMAVSSNVIALREQPLYQQSTTSLFHSGELRDESLTPEEAFLNFDVGEMLKTLEEKKRQAISDSQFDVAKRLKLVLVEMHKVKDKFASWKIDIQAAVQVEDFDLANNRKLLIEQLQRNLYQQLQKHHLLDDVGFSLFGKEGTAQSMFLDQNSASNRSAAGSDYSHSRQSSASLFHSVDSALGDDRVLPALSKLNQESTTATENEIDETLPPTEPESLTDDNYFDAKSAIDVFGLPLVTSAYSKTYTFRQNALANLFQLLSELPPDTPSDVVRLQLHSALRLMEKGLKDNVISVHRSALNLLEMILVEFIPRHKLGKVDTTLAINQALPSIVQKMSDTAAARCRPQAFDFIVRADAFPALQHAHIMTQHLLTPVKRNTGHRLAHSKMEIAEALLEKHGIKEPWLGLDVLMKLAVSGIEHPSEPVRDRATNLIINLYRTMGSLVEVYLPSENDPLRKNPRYRKLFDEFDKSDDVSVSQGRNKAFYQKKKQNKDSEQKKKEIAELQAQVNQLKAMTNSLQTPAQRANKRNRKNLLDKAAGKAKVNQAAENKQNLPIKSCLFCGEADDAFTDDGLDLHFWKHCPMLTRCKQCKQVVEICSYNEHMLKECAQKSKFTQCPRCEEAILETEFKSHAEKKTCKAISTPDDKNCPLCHQTIQSGLVDWQNHLLGSDASACAGNLRRLPAIERLKSKRETASSSLKV